VAMRAFNDKVAADDRVMTVLLPISDGLTLLLKR
jgi:predicted O-methyltransferase YrrM